MTRAAPARRLAAAVGAAAALLTVVAGCGSGGGTAPPTAPVGTGSDTTGSGTTVSSPAGPDTPTGSDTPGPPASTGAGTPAPTGAVPTSPAPTGPPTTPAVPECADLAVTVTRVPGAAGVTYGLVSVTSRGTARCSLPGIPSLRLLDASRAPVTAAATADAASGGVTVLAPGGVASTLLEDSSATCQADTRSVYLEVKATPAASTVVAPLALPPCALSVKPFVPGTQPAP